MSITKELRKWGYGFCGDTYEVVNAIADRIDAEHERQCAESWMRGHDAWAAIDRSDEMAEHGWIRLPNDEDGEYIRIGDMLMDGLSQSFTPKKVKMLMLEGNEWMLNFGGGWCAMKHHEWHHYHAPTVEDVLREFVHAILNQKPEFREENIAEYAAKLREMLKGDAE